MEKDVFQQIRMSKRERDRLNDLAEWKKKPKSELIRRWARDDHKAMLAYLEDGTTQINITLTADRAAHLTGLTEYYAEDMDSIVGRMIDVAWMAKEKKS